jgi:hypothetical protein
MGATSLNSLFTIFALFLDLDEFLIVDFKRKLNHDHVQLKVFFKFPNCQNFET